MIDWMESKSVDSEAYIRSLYCCTGYIMWSMVDWIGSYSQNSEANTCALYISLASALDQSAFASPILVHVCLCTYVVTSSLCIWILVLCFLLCTCTEIIIDLPIGFPINNIISLMQMCLCIMWCEKLCHHIVCGLDLSYTFGRHLTDRRGVSEDGIPKWYKGSLWSRRSKNICQHYSAANRDYHYVCNIRSLPFSDIWPT